MSSSPGRRAGLPVRACGGLLVAAITIACYLPALRAGFVADDFGFVAIARFVGHPWRFFVHDHFPLGLYFRPLGLFVWWLTCAAADASPRAQYLVNIALHLACCGALYSLMRHVRPAAAANLAWTALFAVHPLALGAALWLSDRFDVLATLFALLATRTAFAYAARASTGALVASLTCIALALASKELGVIAPAAAFAAIAFAPRSQLPRRERIVALACIVGLMLAWLAYRHAMLMGSATGGAGFPAAADWLHGTWRWLAVGAQLLVSDPRAGSLSIASLAGACLLCVAALVSRPRTRGRDRPRWNVVAAIVALTLLPAFVQAPAMGALAPIDAQSSIQQLVASSRFYYLASAGLACALMLLTTAVAHRRAPAPSKSASLMSAAAFALAVLALAPIARRSAAEYAKATRATLAATHALQESLVRIDTTRPCQVYLLGTRAFADFAGYSDAIAKGLAADPQRLAQCTVSTERAAWMYFVPHGALAPADLAPLQPMHAQGQTIAGLELGGLDVIFLEMPADAAARLPATATFLRWEAGAFIDVSAAIRADPRSAGLAGSAPTP